MWSASACTFATGTSRYPYSDAAKSLFPTVLRAAGHQVVNLERIARRRKRHADTHRPPEQAKPGKSTSVIDPLWHGIGARTDLRCTGELANTHRFPASPDATEWHSCERTKPQWAGILLGSCVRFAPHDVGDVNGRLRVFAGERRTLGRLVWTETWRRSTRPRLRWVGRQANVAVSGPREEVHPCKVIVLAGDCAGKKGRAGLPRKTEAQERFGYGQVVRVR